MNDGKEKTTILVSGFGLGFYIPGLLLRDQLERAGEQVDAEVFETLFDDLALAKVWQSRDTYRGNFKLAKTAQRVPFDVRGSIDPARLEALLDHWAREHRRKFVVMSGHWIHVLDAYRAKIGLPLDVVLLHMDGSLAPSWLQTARLVPDYAHTCREMHLYELVPPSINFILDAGLPPPAWTSRGNSVVVHGGGWGLGTFQDTVTELANHGLHVIEACYDVTQAAPDAGRTRVANSPTWRAWHKDHDGRLQYPPCGVIDETGWHERASDHPVHGMHELIGRSIAVVSKPGAGSLIDCLSTLTPLVMLDPFGDHEAASGKIWLDLGLGVPFEEWRRSGFSRTMLDEVRGNLEAAAAARPKFAAEVAAMSGQEVRV